MNTANEISPCVSTILRISHSAPVGGGGVYCPMRAKARSPKSNGVSVSHDTPFVRLSDGAERRIRCWTCADWRRRAFCFRLCPSLNPESSS